MGYRQQILSVLALLLLTFCLAPPLLPDILPESGHPHSPGLQPLFKRYSQGLPAKIDWLTSPTASTPGVSQDFPGWIVGSWHQPPTHLLLRPWPFREQTYVILLPDKKTLARMIYHLALFARDLDPQISLEQFEGGAQGFHYSLTQLLDWLNSLTSDPQPTLSSETTLFIQQLLADGVIAKQGHSYHPNGRITHIIGAAPGHKRDLALNLNHERLHVLWDLNPDFRASWLKKWQALTPDQKQHILAQFKGYEQQDELHLVEEWAVRESEHALDQADPQP